MADFEKTVAFVVNGETTATLGADGKLEPSKALQVRIDQIDNRSEIARQEWIVKTFGTGDPGNPGPLADH